MHVQVAILNLFEAAARIDGAAGGARSPELCLRRTRLCTQSQAGDPDQQAGNNISGIHKAIN
jgi:hypothetical protein